MQALKLMRANWDAARQEFEQQVDDLQRKERELKASNSSLQHLLDQEKEHALFLHYTLEV